VTADVALARLARLARLPVGGDGWLDESTESLDRESAAQARAARAIRRACGLPARSKRTSAITLEDGRPVVALPHGQYLEGELDGRSILRCLVVSERTAGING
jgi:hypothetical protein